jgi:uncharacterized protein (DUF58 family)
MRRVSTGITPIGWSLIAVAAASYVVGVVFAWREMLIVAGGSLLLLAMSAVWLLGRLGLEVERPLGRDRVEVGERLIAEVLIRNPQRRPIGPRLAEDRFGEHTVPIRVPALGARGEHLERYVVPTERRGAFALGPITVVRADPFGFLRRERRLGPSYQVFVTPTVHAIGSPARSWARDMDGPTYDTSPQGGTVFHTLREYVRGDDYRHIHWRSSARTGTLMIRQYVDTRRPSTLLLFDTRADEYSNPEMFELAVEVVASIAVSAVRASRPLAAFALGADLGGIHAGELGEVMLERLCMVTSASDATIAALMDRVRLANVDPTEIVFVTGGGGDGLADALRSLPRGALTVVRAQEGLPSIALPRGRVIDASTPSEFVVQWNALVRV